MSEALTEICKMDPEFSKEEFLKKCEYDIIPTVLEAMVRGDLEILKDWCHEGPYNILSTPIKQALALGKLSLKMCTYLTSFEMQINLMNYVAS